MLSSAVPRLAVAQVDRESCHATSFAFCCATRTNRVSSGVVLADWPDRLEPPLVGSRGVLRKQNEQVLFDQFPQYRIAVSPAVLL